MVNFDIFCCHFLLHIIFNPPFPSTKSVCSNPRIKPVIIRTNVNEEHKILNLKLLILTVTIYILLQPRPVS